MSAAHQCSLLHDGEGPMETEPEMLRALQLGTNLIGFYDGRVPDKRYHSSEPNWLDDGGYALGICSSAVAGSV